jgi:nitrate/TMAO reductase-like tetraheme cytochrome c subunit
MKQIKFLRIMLAILVMASFALTSCTKEGPTGPAGKDGVDGVDGANGSDGLPGVDATAVCITCHTTVNMNAKQSEYQFSKHFTGNTSARFGKYCARCHTSEGYLEVTSNGQPSVRNDIANATRINCTTCHKHGGFDFENSADTVSMIMRVVDPVTLVYNSESVDFGALNNTCVTCHQIRGTTTPKVSDTTGTADPNYVQLAFFPLDNALEGTTVQYKVGQSYSVHDGNQANLFKGIYGYEYVGKTYTKEWIHSDNNCTTCHMNELNADGTRGGHTLLVNEEKCMDCHGQDVIGNIQTEVDFLRVQLGEALVAKKLFRKQTNSEGVVSYSAVNSHDYYGNLFPTTETSQRFGVSLTSSNTVDPKTGLVVYNSIVKPDVDVSWSTRIGREWTYGELGAAYNYGYINSELSKGVHNPTYAKQLLQTSIEYLNAH